MTIYTPLDRATEIDALSLMLAQFAVSTYECHLIAMMAHEAEPATGDTLTISSPGGRLDLTGPSPFGMDDSMEYVARRICGALSEGATITVGDARLAIGPMRPIEHAYRPTEDVLVLRRGGATPTIMTIIADRARGPAN